jgi:hypothetical protein
MKTILFIFFAGILLILLSHWSLADFVNSNTVVSSSAKPSGETDNFAYDVRLDTYQGRMQIVRQGALEAMKVVNQWWYTSASALAGSIEVEYFHVQLGRHDAAVKICGGPRMNYGDGSQAVEWRGSAPDDFQRGNLRTQIKVFPRVFDKRAYWITAENRWAETAVEAVKNVVLEGLTHVEQYIYEQTGPPVRLLASVGMSDDQEIFEEVPTPLSRPGRTR